MAAWPSGLTLLSDGVPAADGLHLACGHFHDFEDSCPAPVDSPPGRLERVMQPTINNPTCHWDVTVSRR
jgi:hypothetical protein